MISEIKYKIKDLPEEKRPREKIIKDGPGVLTNSELLAIVLNTGIKKGNYKEDVLELSRRILKEYGKNSIIKEKNIEKLMKDLDIPQVKACQIVACFELGRRFFKKEKKEIFLRTPKDAFDYLRDEMTGLKKEQFRGLYLNSRNELIHDEVISLGTLTSSIVHPREIFRPAIEYSAAAIILAHNHPSGDPTPSEEDVKIAKRIAEVSRVTGIDILDHLIIGEKKFTSFKEKGLLSS